MISCSFSVRLNSSYYAYSVIVILLVGSIASITQLSGLLLLQQSFASLGSIKEVDTDNNKMLYDQGDDVLIHGVIQDIQPNQNSVGITVTDPHGGKNTYTAEVGSDGGQFNTVYSLSNTASEGIYTVKV